MGCSLCKEWSVAAQGANHSDRKGVVGWPWQMRQDCAFTLHFTEFCLLNEQGGLRRAIGGLQWGLSQALEGTAPGVCECHPKASSCTQLAHQSLVPI